MALERHHSEKHRLYARFMSVFFFFQAEDGIRDYKVTGVQTCALPISKGGVRSWMRNPSAPARPCASRPVSCTGDACFGLTCPKRLGRRRANRARREEIGRASCRERV